MTAAELETGARLLAADKSLRDEVKIRIWLRTHAAELIADSVRLSWLDRDDVELHASTESGKPFVYIALATTGQQIAKGDTIRAAIDAARASK